MEVIAEAGITHDGRLSTALKLADSALVAGADACKFQTFIPSKLFRKSDPVLEKLALSFSDFVKLAKHCDDIGIEFMSTPGDLDSLKFLVEECGVKRIKIGSDDLTYKPLVDAAFMTGLPVILSTGMATLREIDKATYVNNDQYDAIVAWHRVTLMHCVSLYPCPPEKANLKAITTLRECYPCRIGYSDHTHFFMTAHLALALGATIIEKHFSPDDYGGPDAEVSLIPKELKVFIESLKHCQSILGSGKKEPCMEEKANIKIFRKGKDGLRGLE